MSEPFTTSRHWVVALSAFGAANMALGSARQLGLIRHLPDPPLRGFDSNRVIVSPEAFALGIPDAPVAMAGMLANLPLAIAGGARRYARRPWLPVVIAAKSVVEVSVAAWYLVQMRTRLHTWCAYCLFGASINVLLAALTLREANAALESPRRRAAGALAYVAIAALAFGAMTLMSRREPRDARRLQPRSGS